MPHEALRATEAAAWMRKAADDLRGSQVDLDASPPLIEDSLFHSQQAVEKALKAFLTWHNTPFRKVHDLSELGELCVGVDAGLDAFCRRAEKLTVFATVFRYPGNYDAPPREEAIEALEIARGFRDNPLALASAGRFCDPLKHNTPAQSVSGCCRYDCIG